VRLAFLGAVVALLTGCGYGVSGHADALPKTVQTIAVPTFDNVTNRYKLSDRLAAAISREFLSRTRYRIVPDPNDADAVLRGAVTNYYSVPNVTDQTTGRAAGIQVTVVLQATLTDRAGKVLFTRPALEFRQRYEIAVDQAAYFEESDVALDRLSREVARTLVSSVLEAF
jgi:outer membrane lipopolysaccharide assembly protein LptE/RlpB